MIRRIKAVTNKLIRLKGLRAIKIIASIGKLLLKFRGLKSHIGGIKANSNKQTVIVVSHEASATEQAR